MLGARQHGQQGLVDRDDPQLVGRDGPEDGVDGWFARLWHVHWLLAGLVSGRLIYCNTKVNGQKAACFTV
ncbi:hypothetical protein GCM10009850_020910 [Nonomuraea monospora]|uniref:Transposase n=1 Tax=Nonomuraea monospora TaxID=568818 RepID=A0ABN3CBA9_9ACTN